MVDSARRVKSAALPLLLNAIRISLQLKDDRLTGMRKKESYMQNPDILHTGNVPFPVVMTDDSLFSLQNLDSASIGRPRPQSSMTEAARVWFMGAGRSRAMSAVAMWQRQRSGALLRLATKGSKPSQQAVGGAGTLALVRKPAHGIKLLSDDRHSLGSVGGGGGGVTL